MMFNRDVRRKKGFSLIELLVVMVITLVLVGVAAMYLEEYVYKGKVSKAMQDLDMFRSALQLYDATETKAFSNYNYQGNGEAATFGFAYSTAGIANFYGTGVNEVAATLGGATTAWTNYAANSLKDLLGKYLMTLPNDPFGAAYVVNSSAGYAASLGADQSTASNIGRNKDLIMYYLTERPVLTDVVVNDVNGDQKISVDDSIDFVFSKDVTAADAALVPATHLVYTDGDLIDQAIAGFTVDDGTLYTNAATAKGAIRLLNNGRILRFVVTAAPTTPATLIGKKIKFKTGTNTFADSISDNNPYFRNDTTGKARTIDTTNGNPYVKVRIAGTF